MTNERKKVGEVKQVEGKGFDKVGDSYEGVYRSRKKVTINERGGSRESTLHTLEPDEGDAFGVWGNTLLDDLLSQVAFGTYVKVTLTELRVQDGKPKTYSPLKVFKVETFE
jgi:hypothetical protein